MGSDVYLKFDGDCTAPYQLSECDAEKHQLTWTDLNNKHGIISKANKEVGGNIRLTYDWTQAR